ncbi:MAG: transcription-repair coupling factor, partial [Aquiluna sp.]|nr:transcription-repair coupling factor [Aquiluna sp.]
MTLGPLMQVVAQSYPADLLAKKKLNFFAPSRTHAVALAQFIKQSKQPVAVIVASGNHAAKLSESLSELVPKLELIEFPSWETLPHERLSPAAETVGKRLKALHRMLEIQNGVDHPVALLISIRAALQPVMGGLEDHPPFTLTRGNDYLLPELSLKLIELAYERVDMVSRRGEFAIRGGILDVFPTTASHALRLEFFGDQLEDIREFNVSDQRSIASQLDSVDLYAARELIITPSVSQRAREMAGEFPGLNEMLSKIGEGIPVSGMESLAPLLGVKLGPITDYLKKTAVVVLEPERIMARAQSLVDTNEEFLHAAWDAAIEGATAPIDFSKGGFYEPETFFDLIRKDHSIIEIDSLQKADAVDLGLRQIPSFTRESPAVGWLQDQQSQGMRIVIVARGHGTAERIVEILSGEQLPVVLTEVLGDPASEHITCVVGNLDSGFVMQDQKLIVLSETEFFGVSGAYASPKERKLARRRGQQVDPLALKAGDYVVHEIHGIGRFKELIQRQNRNQVREYLLIEYAP